ncbi:aminotransferase class I/II-fold pyridoxal phosphate-dependent enzyme [Bosea sp. 117]|uniref:DegT/DnrJ/EryC1/StrS family aminotransferase n=1 Tax=Bosea sp. 117 TaxID=1125973 RepID=UPI0004947ABD|nr:aminotransferase class I/II-fold pyridoxal phosphate-dependent enzyme [Bosea sp. 117]
MKPDVFSVVAQYRYPFIRPRLPDLAEVAEEFARSRAANFYSNFGPCSIALEEDIEAAYLTDTVAVTCANCTAGLSGALIALKVDGPVLIPAFTFPATLSAVRGAGLEPVVGDVDPTTGVLDAAAAEAAIAARGCRAVIAVRPYGIWGDMSALAEVCRRAGVPLIIDNAAGLGVSREVVARYAVPGAIELFSLHATKPFGVGEGGIAIGPAAMENELRSAFNFGLWTLGSLKPGQGINGKMDELTAAMARVVLRYLPRRLAQRQAMAARYNLHAAQVGIETFCAVGQEEISPWQCFALRLPEGVKVEALIAASAASGLQVRRYYFPPLAYEGEAPPEQARRLSSRAVCLPIYDGAEAAQADEIWSVFTAALATAS